MKLYFEELVKSVPNGPNIVLAYKIALEVVCHVPPRADPEAVIISLFQKDTLLNELALDQ